MLRPGQLMANLYVNGKLKFCTILGALSDLSQGIGNGDHFALRATRADGGPVLDVTGQLTTRGINVVAPRLSHGANQTRVQ